MAWDLKRRFHVTFFFFFFLKQIDYILDQYTHTKEKAFDDLDSE